MTLEFQMVFCAVKMEHFIVIYQISEACLLVFAWEINGDFFFLKCLTTTTKTTTTTLPIQNCIIFLGVLT